jgi:methyl-accepting chemotaxis protein
MQVNRKGLLMKILLQIGLPVAITFCVVAAISLHTVSNSVSILTERELTAESKAVSNEISGYLAKYIEVAKQMATNTQFEDLMLKTGPGMVITGVDGFAPAKRAMDNVYNTDPDNIMVSWIADFDSSQFTQSDGYLSGADYDVTTRGWYKDLIVKKQVFITEPYEDTATKKIIVSVVAPVYRPGTKEMIGATCIDVSIDHIKQILKDSKIGKTGFYIVTTDKGDVFYHPDENYINKNLTDTKMSKNIIEALNDKKAGEIIYTSDGTKSRGYVSQIGKTGWMIASGLPDKEFQSAYNVARATMLTIFLIALALIVLLIIIMARRIVKPIKNLAAAADKLAMGDVDADIETGSVSNDEIGELTEAFAKMTENIRAQAMTASKIAEGNLDLKVEVKSEKDILGLSMMSVIDTLKQLVAEAEDLTAAAVKGRLETRGAEDRFTGGYKLIVQGFNKTLDAVIRPLNMSANYMERISKGDIPPLITDEYYGDFERIKENINTCISTINSLVTDMNQLSAETATGQILSRADAGKQKGEFARIVEGVNLTLDTLVGYIDEMPIPVMIIEKEFGIQYMNKSGALVLGKSQHELLGKKCYDGFKTSHCHTENCACARAMKENGKATAETDAHPNGGNMEISYTGAPIKNQNNEIIGAIEFIVDQTDIKNAARIGKKQAEFQLKEIEKLIFNLEKISVGDLDVILQIEETDQDTDVVGQNFEKLNSSLAVSIKAIKTMIDDVNSLAEAAVGGDLKNRADVTKHGGEFAKIMEGFNKTLDAVIAPINEASAVLQEMAKGNLQVTMEGDYQGDHAAIKNALNETLSNLRSYVSELTAVLSEISNGNLNLAITADYKGDFVEIKNSLNDITASLGQVMGDISEAADQVASGSRQVSDGSQALSQGSTEQASSIQELTASIAEIASQTKQNAVNANQASQLAGTARDNAERGNSQMKDMLNSMEEINESSANISKIIRVIDDIAFQTNILALNAAVEAARAGQHGKGFAVVAEEVRNLAARSATAARETTELIEGSIRKAQAGTKIANETATALSEIVDGIEKSAGLVVNIAEASNEQASGIAQINKGIEQVSMVTQNNSATAEESAAASEELSSQAELLKEMVGRFKVSKDVKGLPGADMRLLGSTGESQTKQKKTAAEPRILLGNDNLDKY